VVVLGNILVTFVTMLTYGVIRSLFSKKAFISLILVGLGAWAIASMGGGGSKKEKTVKPEFTPIRTSNGFTLRAGPVYSGSMIFGQEKNKNLVSLNSIVTYQKGNTTYILPCRYKVQASSPAQGSSLQMFNLKIKIH
jgi:hypothetical protein